MTLHSGKLNRRILIQKRVDDYDSAGQQVDEWTDVCRVWAWVRTASGVSSMHNTEGVARAITRYSFRIRYNLKIQADMRIIYQGMYFDIKEVLHDIAGHEHTDIVANLGGAIG